MQQRVETVRVQLEEAIAKEQTMRRNLAGQPGMNLEQVALERHIREMQQTLADLQGRLNKYITRKVEASGQTGFSATLVDGREFTSLHADYASNVDLAIFQLPTMIVRISRPGTRAGSLSVNACTPSAIRRVLRTP